MPLYAYQAVYAGGRRTRGRLSAATAQALIRDLEGRGLLALHVDETVEQGNSLHALWVDYEPGNYYLPSCSFLPYQSPYGFQYCLGSMSKGSVYPLS